MAIAILFLGGAALTKIPTDIFPNIDIPVVTVIWTYTGLSPQEVEHRISTFSEFQISNNVSDIKNIESQSLPGVSVERIYFQPTVNIDLAIAQIVSVTNSVRSQMPPGINPPIVIRFSASSVPVLQLSISGQGLSEQSLYDYALYRGRQQITSVPGATVTAPYGGKPRQIMVDLDPDKLLATGLTPLDVTQAINAQNLTMPSGQMKIGASQYIVQTNATPSAVEMLNAIPIRKADGSIVYVRDVAHVRDGSAIQQNIVRTEGKRSVLMTILKSGNASTLDVVNQVKNEVLPVLRAAAPAGMHIDTLFDQSLFVVQSIDDVVQEGIMAAALTSLMILLFLGSWRSTLVVLVSIPLAILFSLTALFALGQTMNVMTLGGLALSVGILVDHATITIENTHRLIDEGKGLLQATVEGTIGVGKPSLVATVAICAAFVSVFFLTGPARYLFVPQALAVVFAMLASYGLSRTLVPICINAFLAGETHGHDSAPGWFGRLHGRFNVGFDRLRDGYANLLVLVLTRRAVVPLALTLILAATAALVPFVGQDYFPQVDGGQIRLHVRGRSGLRIENTEKLFQSVEDVVRSVIPDKDRGLMIDNIGMPASNTNLAYNDNSLVGLNDGQILISLNEGHAPTASYMRELRLRLPQQFPDAIFYFQPADIMTQILNFGLPAPIDIQVVGRDTGSNLDIARDIRTRLHDVTGAVDVHLHQIVDAPELFVDVDRDRAAEFGTTAQSIAQNLNVSLSSSYQVAPNFWTDPRTGIPYPVAVQTPEYRMDRMSALKDTGVTAASGQTLTLLSNVATISRNSEPTVANHTNVQPVYDVYANIQDRDLGGVAKDIAPIVKAESAKLKPGNSIVVRGQISSMNQAFAEIGVGLVFAAVFVYLLMVLNFQTWVDPFVVICALPGAMCGIVFMLFLTGTTFSIPSLMGAVMSVGVASANSILLVTFAKELQESGRSAFDAAFEAGIIRLRPILMTAGAMIVGMIPMALNLGGGSEENAALGRAVIGGLLVG
ncbi:MAG TPA: efflux RND transporter permease subunit, partial [Patescibacteria group bacterium]|nr:efflux RND transporter permease subunit [Patescibacteria group bacterium]